LPLLKFQPSYYVASGSWCRWRNNKFNFHLNIMK